MPGDRKIEGHFLDKIRDKTIKSEGQIK